MRLPGTSAGTSDSGIWPAFWTLGDNFSGWDHDTDYGGDTAWSASGEIDIMELFGVNESATTNLTSGALHWVKEGCIYNVYVPSINHCSTGVQYTSPLNVYTNYHLYGVEWTNSQMQWFVNDESIGTLDISDSQFDPFRLAHFILLNVAVGGNPVGNPISANYPLKMYVDWVRHYQCPEGDTCALSLAVISCPLDHISDGSYVIYSDCAGTSLPDTFMLFGGFSSTATATSNDDGGGQDTFNYLNITGTGAETWAAGGWARSDSTSTLDLSSYGTAHLSVRSASTAVNSITLKMEDSTQATGVGKEIERTFTGNSGWQDICIPLSEFTTGTDAVDLSTLRAPFVYVLSGNSVSIDIDEAYFATATTCS